MNRPGDGRVEIKDSNPHLCTNIIYGYIGIDADTSIIRGTHQNLKKVESRNSYLKICEIQREYTWTYNYDAKHVPTCVRIPSGPLAVGGL